MFKIGKKHGRKWGMSIINSQKRYEADMEEYRFFLTNMKAIPYHGEYFDFYLNLLSKELRYSSLLEVNRYHTKNRYLYPFHCMDDRLLFGKEQKYEEVEIDIRENNLISEPWNHTRYADILYAIQKNGFKYQITNHMAYYYDGLNITCAYNGLHSLGAGVYWGNGKIKAQRINVTSLFEVVDAYNDLSFGYNEKNIRKKFEDKGMIIPAKLKKSLEDRFYGTDYRLILIYELSKRRYLEIKESRM